MKMLKALGHEINIQDREVDYIQVLEADFILVQGVVHLPTQVVGFIQDLEEECIPVPEEGYIQDLEVDCILAPEEGYIKDLEADCMLAPEGGYILAPVAESILVPAIILLAATYHQERL